MSELALAMVDAEAKKPTPHQQEALDLLVEWWNLPKSHPEWQNCILSAPAGCGKAQPLDEPVLTTTGFKKMEDVLVGDYVYSEEGTPIRVLETFTTPNLNMYEVMFSDDTSTVCCEDHLWLVYPERLRKTKGTSILSLKEMLPNIQRDKTPKQSYAYRIPVTKGVKFPVNETLLHCYTFGYALGNGSSAKVERSSQLVLTIAQQDFQGILQNIPEKYILSTKEEKINTLVSLICLNESFRIWYDSFGLRGVTSVNKFIPNDFLVASKEQRMSLLMGLCDSDGTCTNNKARFSTSSYRLAKDFKQLVLSLGGIASIYSNQRIDKGDNANTEYGVQFRVPFQPFRLARKAANYIVREEDINAKKSIVSARFYGKLTGKCLVVDSPTHLYLTKDYIVTHNTFLAKYFTAAIKDAMPCFTATTNEAGRQLALAGVNVYGTIHSALGLTQTKNSEKVYFIQSAIPEAIWEHNLIVIDEASMAGKADFSLADAIPLVVDYAMDLGIRCLWLGDGYQLPPVESTNAISPIFEQGWRTIYLTEVMRNSGNILNYCTSIRGTIDKKSRSFPHPPRCKEIAMISPADLYPALRGASILDDLRQGTTRIIVWRNSNADRLNNFIRIGLHGEELAKEHPLLPTDQILFTSPVFGIDFPKDSEYLVGWDMHLQASVNTRAEVTSVVRTELYGLEVYKCKFRLEDAGEIFGYVLTTEGKARFDKLKSAFIRSLEGASSKKKQDSWFWWHTFDSCFCKLKHSYAITTHRAQGSNIPNVVVDVKDILSAAWNQPLLAYKMLYTACSRTKNHLTLVKER